MKKVFTILCLCSVAILFACEPALENIFEVYTIEKNDHYSNPRHIESLQSNVLIFQARFDSSAIYTLAEAYQDSKNKLLGFADCNSMHHENSARFAWQWYHNSIEIYAYCYANGERVEEFLGRVGIGEIASYKLELAPGAYVFTFKDRRVEIARTAKCNTGMYYMLWPYFGGQLPAPHDISISIKRY